MGLLGDCSGENTDTEREIKLVKNHKNLIHDQNKNLERNLTSIAAIYIYRILFMPCVVHEHL